MAKISELADGGNLLNDDELIVLRAGGNVRATVANLPEVDASGNMAFADNEKATFGTGSDLQIYHDGSHNFIEGTNAGNIYIRNGLDDGDVIIQSDNGSGGVTNYIQADGSNGEVRLFHYGSEKLNTTSTGIDVTGTAVSDGLTVQTSQGDITIPTNTSSLNFARAGTNYIRATDASGSFNFVTGANDFATTRLRIASNGDVLLYEDTGTSPKFHWDASAESLRVPLSLYDNSVNAFPSEGYASVYSTGAGGSAPFNEAGHLVLQARSSGALRDILFATGNGAVERMRISSDGSVGIGTDDPSSYTFNTGTTAAIEGDTNSQLSIISATDGVGYLAFGDGTTGTDRYSGLLEYRHSDDSLRLRTAGYEAMRITSDGSVGIGTDSPSGKFDVVMGTGNRLIFTTTGSDTFVSSVNEANNAYSNLFINGEVTKLGTGGTEACRIDSSQNLLVGKSGTAFGTAGSVLYSNGLTTITRDGGAAVQLNRLTSDGAVQTFSKDGTTVGSISTFASRLTIGSGDTGVVFAGDIDTIYPVNGTSARDDAVSLGADGARFKNLFLSGGAYLGGTAAANKLDDYEEGTFTPTFSITGATITHDIQTGTYTKIGNMVYFHLLVGTDAATGVFSTSNMLITGMPFVANNAISGAIGVSFNFATTLSDVKWSITNGTTVLSLYKSANNVTQVKGDQFGTGSDNNRLYISGCYQTNS